MTAVEAITHIVRDERGKDWITGANVKVLEVVLDHLAYGWSVDEIHEQHPWLSLGQIHAGLAYYYDHQAELEAQIKAGLETVRAIRAQTGDVPMQRRLRAAALAK